MKWFAFVFTALGLYFLGSAFVDLKTPDKTETWIKTTGMMQAASVEARSRRVEAEGTHDAGSIFFPAVKYTYNVNGMEYHGSRITYDTQKISFNGTIEAKQILANWPVGTDTTVYYDPGRPQESVLLHGRESHAFDDFMTAIAMLGASMGFWIPVYLDRNKKSRRGIMSD